ncbi:MAG: aspartate ammonia-lyase, partial [Alcaligenaceae bacterium]
RTLHTNCIDGIGANRTRLAEIVSTSVGLVAALNPWIGYAHATEIAQEALREGRGIAELVLERGLLTEDQIEELLSPRRLTGRSASCRPG